MERVLTFLLLIATLLFIVQCKPVPDEKKAKKRDYDWKREEDPAYVKYLKQVVEILEEDENFSKKLENVTEDDIRSGKIAHEVEFASHHVRSKLDELKRKEIEYQKQLLRQQNDLKNGVHREYWNPLNDKQNPNTFEVADLKRLLAKHHEEMEMIDQKRKEDFRRHEMEKEHKRRKHEKTLDEEKRKLEGEERKKLHEKHLEDAKRVNHPGSKAQLEEVWEEEDGLEKDQFNPKTFFRLHDKDGNGFLDPAELESLFVNEASKIHNRTDPDFDPRALQEEVERMREHVVNQIDKDKDGFVSLEEFMGSTNEEEYEKPPDETWKGIDDENEFTDEEFDDFEKDFEDWDEEEDLPEEDSHTSETEENAAPKVEEHVPLAHTQEQEKAEHEQQQQQQQQT